MKSFCIFTVVFLLAGICSVSAQAMIILKDGNMIEAKVTEISPTEIRYKRFEHLDGPTIVIPAANVLSIRYENGTYDIINAGATKNTAMDPNKFTFGINANAGGAIGYAWGGSTGAGINIELGKGRFNSEINLMFPIGGFGALVTFNGFWPSQIGGAYLGGGIGFSICEASDLSLTAGLNAGYKFVTKSGLYFRTGGFVGFDFGFIWDGIFPVYIKPDLSIGWTMR
jgi:hypothetical protein